MVGTLIRSNKANTTTSNFFANKFAAVDKMISYISYSPRMNDEISLAIGDSVVIMHRYDDNWCLAKNESTGATGMVPGNYLHNINNPFLPDTMTVNNTKPPVRKISLALKDKLNNISSADEYSAPQPVNNAAVKIQNYGENRYGYSERENKHLTLAVGNDRQLFNSADELSIIDPNEFAEAANGSKIIYGASGRPSIARNVDYDLVESLLNKWQAVQRVHHKRSRTSQNVGFSKFGIVGDSGIGKTSLTRAFMEMDDIIKSDTDYMLFESNYYEGASPSNYGVKMSDVLSGPSELVEIHGCTMDTRKTILSNGKTLMIEQPNAPMPMNLTLIDTPGYSSDLDALTVLRPLIAYQAREFEKTNSVFSNDVPSQYLKGFLAGSTGAHGHIDGIFYCILHRLTAVDIELMRRLSKVACIIPVLMKCDTLNKKELVNLRLNVLTTLCKENINFYGFGFSKEEIMTLLDFARNLPLLSRDGKGAIQGYEEGLLANIQSAEDLFNIINFPFTISTKVSNITPISSEMNETEIFGVAELKQSVFYDHIDDIRRHTADGFIKWREAVSKA